jgi:peptide methionine sulfoxide reductase MsrA
LLLVVVVSLACLGFTPNKWSTNFAFFRSKPTKRQYRHILFLNAPNNHHDNDTRTKMHDDMVEAQKEAMRTKIRALEQTSPVYVSVEPLSTFYRAEEHHQHFFVKSRERVAEANRLRGEG